MNTSIIAMMLFVSIALGGAGLLGLLWGLKTRQFEDHRRFLDGALDDSEDALNDAYRLQKRKDELKNSSKA